MIDTNGLIVILIAVNLATMSVLITISIDLLKARILMEKASYASVQIYGIMESGKRPGGRE